MTSTHSRGERARPSRLAAATAGVMTAALAATLVPATPAHAARGMHVSKVRYNPVGNDRARLNREFLVLRNTRRKAVNLDDWRLVAAGRAFRLRALRVPAGGRVKVHSGRGKRRPGHTYLRSRRPVWPNHGRARARIKRPSGTVADRYSYRAPAVLRGEASWYGKAFAGNRTACGDRFNPGARTLASRELPCGTVVTVRGPKGSVTARVNDYGPARGTGRRFDLSRKTFNSAGNTRAGVMRVTVREL